MILATLLLACAPQAAGQTLQGTVNTHLRCLGLDAKDGRVAATWNLPSGSTADSTYVWSTRPGMDELVLDTTLPGRHTNCALGPDGIVVTSNGATGQVHVPGAQGGAWSSSTLPPVTLARSFGEDIDIEGRRMAISSETFAGSDEFVVSVYDLPVGSTTWVPVGRVREPRQTSAGAFYVSVSLEGDDLLVGTRTVGHADLGQVRVYRLVAGSYQFVQTLDRSVIFNGEFGQEVATDGGRALVAGTRNNNTGLIAAYERNAGGVWQQTFVFNDPQYWPADRFGRNIEMAGDRAMIGASALPVGESQVGQALLYERDSATGRWNEAVSHRDAGPGLVGSFGDEIALDVSNGAVKTFTSAAFGGSLGTGFVWAHDIADWSAPTIDVRGLRGSSYCEQPVSSTGHTPSLRALGTTEVANNGFRLRVEGLPPGKPILLVGASDAVPSPIGPFGVLCATQGLFRMPPLLVTGANGAATLAIDLSALPTNPAPTSVLPGTSWYFQGIYRDQGVGATNALGVTFR